MSASHNRIVLKGRCHHKEGVADSAISPGMDIAMAPDGKFDPNQAKRGAAAGPVMIAKEDGLQGKSIDDAYATADIVFYYMPSSGDEVNLLVKDGQTIAVGDLLIGDGGGTGLWVELSAGAVTQLTSITTAVTVSTVTGTITTVSSNLAAAAETKFQVNNTLVEAGDVVSVSIQSTASAGTPMVFVSAVAAGIFGITISNLHAADALNNTLIIGFAIVGKTGKAAFKALEALSPSGANGFVRAERV